MEYLSLNPDQMAKILRARRKSLELTQKEAAELVGFMPKIVSALNFEMRLHPKESSHETEKKPEW